MNAFEVSEIGGETIGVMNVQADVRACCTELQAQAQLAKGQLLVIGASSSEILGKRIGSATSLAVGKELVETVLQFARSFGFDVAFQCCEHLNRALVIEEHVARARGYTIVSAIPIPGAGGAVAAEAYALFKTPCLVEQISAEAGIDIGDTFIGMHLRRVVVPIRPTQCTVGHAHVTMARTRPPYIGGTRAVYDRKDSPVFGEGDKTCV